MTLAPLFAATPPIPLHAWAAVAALVLGGVQLSLPKGTALHRFTGWLWASLMAAVAVSSLWIHTICTVGPFSPIHLLSIVTLAALPLAVLRARRGQIAGHRWTMILLYVGALVIAGLFTLWPGRIMHDVVFGTAGSHGACA